MLYWGGGTLVALALAAIAVFAPSALSAKTLERGIALIGRMPARWYALGVGLIASALSAFFSSAVFQHAASTSDELAQLWQSRILLSGRWSLPVDANPEFFGLDTVVDAGEWYSQFPVGGPLLLALGGLIGAPWIVNVLCAGIASIAMYAFARRAYGESVGRTVAAVFATTPSIVIMSGTMMNHVPVLMLAVCTLALLTEWDRYESAGRSRWCAAAIGLLLGVMATLRPIDAAIVIVVTAVFQCVIMLREPRRFSDWFFQGVAGVIGASPLFIANKATTGRWTQLAYEVQWGAGHGLGFHTDPYGHPYTFMMGLERMVTYVSELNMFVTAWPVPVVVLAIISLLLIRKVDRWDVLLLALFFVQLLVHGAYWGVGEFLGPRFLFTALPTLVVLVARAPHLLQDRLRVPARRGVLVFFVACAVITWCVPAAPLNAWGLARIARDARRTLRVDPAKVVREAQVHNAVVFLREPFSARLTRRMWGLGISRTTTSQLLSKKDACSLHSAVLKAESEPRRSGVNPLLSSTAAFEEGELSMRSTDGVLSLSSPASLTGDCRQEFDSDAAGGFVPFGVGLAIEPIDARGKVDGDIVYVADLGDANERLRSRFGGRSWYRLTSSGLPGGRQNPTLTPYVTKAK